MRTERAPSVHNGVDEFDLAPEKLLRTCSRQSHFPKQKSQLGINEKVESKLELIVVKDVDIRMIPLN